MNQCFWREKKVIKGRQQCHTSLKLNCCLALVSFLLKLTKFIWHLLHLTKKRHAIGLSNRRGNKGSNILGNISMPIALCQSCGNSYFKVPNFDKLFLCGFSSRVSIILHRVVWTPQEFRKRRRRKKLERKKRKKVQKTWRGCLLRSPLVSKNPSW